MVFSSHLCAHQEHLGGQGAPDMGPPSVQHISDDAGLWPLPHLSLGLEPMSATAAISWELVEGAHILYLQTPKPYPGQSGFQWVLIYPASCPQCPLVSQALDTMFCCGQPRQGGEEWV